MIQIDAPPSLKDLQKQEQNQQKNVNNEAAGDSEAKQKRLRTLRKKLQDVESLEKRIESGQLPNPEKNQLEKIAKKQELIDEIDDIETLLKDLELE